MNGIAEVAFLYQVLPFLHALDPHCATKHTKTGAHTAKQKLSVEKQPDYLIERKLTPEKFPKFKVQTAVLFSLTRRSGSPFARTGS